MNRTRTLLLISLINVAFHINAQQINLLKDTSHYTLELVDSSYYFSHGAEMTSDFEIDSTTNFYNKGIVHLPLLNGAYIEFGDTLAPLDLGKIIVCEYAGESHKMGCYLVGIQYYRGDYKSYLVEKNSGKTDTIDNVPSFSPSSMIYVSNFYNRDAGEAGIVIKNHQTSKSIRITLFDHLDKNYKAYIPYYFRWISNDVFMVHTLPVFGTNSEAYNIKYFLVTLKD
jgi:hypothetical protein